MRPRSISILCILLWSYTLCGQSILPADSVISHTRKQTIPISEYYAEQYIKAQLDIIKKNRFFRFIPGLFKSKEHESRYLSEVFMQMHYTSPNIHDRRITAYTGTIDHPGQIPGTSDLFHINIYSSYLLGENLLSPLSPLAERHYTYHLDSIDYDESQHRQYHIRFTPKNQSFQLLKGHMTITEGYWSVRQILMEGRSDLQTFRTTITLGEAGTPLEYLIVRQELMTSYGFAYNVVEGYYEVLRTYKNIKQTLSKEKRYDRTAAFTLSCDKETFIKNHTLFDSLRPIPLTRYEQYIYNRYWNDTLSIPVSANKARRERWEPAANVLFSKNTWIKDENTVLRSSPFINPLMLSFSKSQGIAYRQEFRFNRILKNESSLHFRGHIGYNFKYNEFYWGLSSNYLYLPERNGIVQLEIGNGNRISNSRITDKLKEIPADSIIDFSRLNLTVFRDLKIKLSHHIEITNGVSAEMGLIFHRRTPTNDPKDYLREGDLPTYVEEGIMENIRPNYVSFAPHIRLKWCPGQYYYKNGRNKINLGGRFPTLTFDYERGVPHVLGSSSIHERIEFDVYHHLRLGVFSHLYYRLGAGIFTQQENAYFVDFSNFYNSALPQGWHDEISGTFQALNRKWYYASPHYARAHITYEAPFLMIPHLMKQTAYVKNERIYLNLLSMRRLDFYMELGYGFSTFVFDLGLFLSLDKFKNTGFGYKLTFNLFND